ncbi:MAG: hypothetical protein EXQ70_04220 [Solirubrobacterales bacterium]|nr:hypothetical protein [Solirubrobacterales bacterium]
MFNAPDTTIGGAAAGDRNYITGGDSGIWALIQGPPNLVIRNNFVGTDMSGTAPLSPPSDYGITVDSVEGAGAQVIGNRIALAGSGVDAMQLQGSDALVQDNLLGVGPAGENLGLGADGIRSFNLHDSTITGNTIGNNYLTGLSLEGDTNNIVQGNLIGTDSVGGDQGGGAARGVLVTSLGIDASTGNTIGGDTTAEENVISNQAGDAIEVRNEGDLQPVPPGALLRNDANVFAGNRGSNNGSTASDLFLGLFDDLNDLGEGPGNPAATGPNAGIQTPVVTVTGPNLTRGTATVGATIRVFAKATASPGELGALLGTGTAGADGKWVVNHNSGQVAGALVTANQTTASAGSSEFAAPLATDATAPQTTITAGPKAKLKAKKTVAASFSFSSEVGASFQCKLDAGAFVACGSPALRKLKLGTHSFQVRAVDLAGNADASPATRSVKVVKKKKKKKGK